MTPLSLEAARALPDAEKNAAVARALCPDTPFLTRSGARGPCASCPECGGEVFQRGDGIWWCGDCKTRWGRVDLAPPYVTAGDKDPFARWDLLAEMLQSVNRQLSEYPPDRLQLSLYARRNKRWNIIGELAYPSGSFINVMGDSPHRAAFEALAAAGLLKGEGDAVQ